MFVTDVGRLCLVWSSRSLILVIILPSSISSATTLSSKSICSLRTIDSDDLLNIVFWNQILYHRMLSNRNVSQLQWRWPLTSQLNGRTFLLSEHYSSWSRLINNLRYQMWSIFSKFRNHQILIIRAWVQNNVPYVISDIVRRAGWISDRFSDAPAPRQICTAVQFIEKAQRHIIANLPLDACTSAAPSFTTASVPVCRHDRYFIG